MGYIFREYKRALIFYIIAGFLIAAFAPWSTGPLWADWLATIIGASFWFFVFVFVRAFWLSYKKRKQG
jgi:hypothetical protein